MFFMVDNIDIASYADDNTPYSVGKSQHDLETKFQKALVKCFKWFHENGLKANQDKCHFLSSLEINTEFFCTQKVPKSETSDFHPLRSLSAQKVVTLVVKFLLNFVLLVNIYL